MGNRLGNSMSLIAIADGSAVRADSNEETARSPHGAEHWSVEANLYPDRQLLGRGTITRPTWSDLPQFASHCHFADDVALDRVGKSVNVVQPRYGRPRRSCEVDPFLGPGVKLENGRSV